MINLRKLNQNILYIYFKMEGLSVLKEFLQARPRDRCFSVAFHQNFQKYLRFSWRGNLYEFLCLCFDVGPAPKIFTKLKQILIALVRSLNVQLIIFLESILFRKLVRENYDVEGHIDFYMAELVG